MDLRRNLIVLATVTLVLVIVSGYSLYKLGGGGTGGFTPERDVGEDVLAMLARVAEIQARMTRRLAGGEEEEEEEEVEENNNIVDDNNNIVDNNNNNNNNIVNNNNNHNNNNNRNNRNNNNNIVDDNNNNIVDNNRNRNNNNNNNNNNAKEEGPLDARDAAIYSDTIMALDLIKSFVVTKLVSAGSSDSSSSSSSSSSSGGGESVSHLLGGRVEEMRKYVGRRATRSGRKNFMGAEATVGSVGFACASSEAARADADKYMGYDVGDVCDDDWPVAQRLMATHGCDPPPRRRCLALGPQYFTSPKPLPESLWETPDDRNVRWKHYLCKSFACLANSTARRGLPKCASCFDLSSPDERRKWIDHDDADSGDGSEPAEFLIGEVLALAPPGSVRIGFDHSVGVGTFAARMRSRNVTIVSSALNLGGPFNELIALRGLVPLHISLSHRLPFFDSTLDLIHSHLLLDGWIDLLSLDFVVFDWDRVLRPGGLLWIDRFFCSADDLDDYLYVFSQLNYKKLKWVIKPKSDTANLNRDEVYFSALLEKPPRPF